MLANPTMIADFYAVTNVGDVAVPNLCRIEAHAENIDVPFVNFQLGFPGFIGNFNGLDSHAAFRIHTNDLFCLQIL